MPASKQSLFTIPEPGTALQAPTWKVHSHPGVLAGRRTSSSRSKRLEHSRHRLLREIRRLESEPRPSKTYTTALRWWTHLNGVSAVFPPPELTASGLPQWRVDLMRPAFGEKALRDYMRSVDTGRGLTPEGVLRRRAGEFSHRLTRQQERSS